MRFEEVLFSRCSVRSYTGEKPTPEAMRTLLLAAQSAPIGCREYDCYRITVIENADLLADLEAVHADCVHAPGAHPLYGAPVLFLFSAKLPGGALDNRYYSSAACMAEQVHLQACALGLGSCLIWNIVRSLNTAPALLARLDLPEGFTPVCSVAVGKTDTAFAPRRECESRVPVNRL